MLGYESEKYSDAKDATRTNHSDRKLVKRGITRLYKFRREYGKLGGINIKVTFDALNRVLGLRKALFLSFLGDLIREHIGLKILSWKKVEIESRDKLWDESTKVGNASSWSTAKEFQNEAEGKILFPNLNTPSKLNELPAKYSAIMKAEEWVEFIENKEIEADEEPSRGTIWLKGRVNKDRKFLDDEIRSVGDKLDI
nr:hypothetical protein [Tanacetum cinerariifolium]